MRTLRTLGLCVLAVLLTAGAAAAQQTPKQYEPPNRAGAGQVFLSKMVGNWKFVDNFYPINGGKPIVSGGTVKQEMIQGGMFLESDFFFKHADGSTSTGLGLSGFSPSTGKFTTVWLDNQRTEMSIRESKGKFNGKDLYLYAQQLDREHPGRQTFAHAYFQGPNTLIYDHYFVQANGKPKLMFQIKMTRQ